MASMAANEATPSTMQITPLVDLPRTAGNPTVKE
jgi:hypothetical protein